MYKPMPRVRIYNENDPNSPLTIDEETKTFFQKVYAWMALGLFISGITAYATYAIPALMHVIIFNQAIFFLLIGTELVLVITLAWLVNKISAEVAVLLFLLYCFTTGLTLSVIFLVYQMSSIGSMFLISAGMFGAVSAYGYYTKKDLTTMGNILFMALLGIIIASVVNLFIWSSMLDFIISIIGVIVFTGLTAYDTQKIKQKNTIGNNGTPEDLKESIIGALTLYLDFINLFLKMLRLFGKRKN